MRAGSVQEGVYSKDVWRDEMLEPVS